jgi:short-subunit dehydrogenase
MITETALITGASSGIGLHLGTSLLDVDIQS